MTSVMIRWSAGRPREPYTDAEAGIEFNTPPKLVVEDWEPVEDAEVGSETDSPPTLVSTVKGGEVEAEAAVPPTLVTTKDPVSTLAFAVEV